MPLRGLGTGKEESETLNWKTPENALYYHQNDARYFSSQLCSVQSRPYKVGLSRQPPVDSENEIVGIIKIETA